MSINPDELRDRINANTERQLAAEHADLEAKIRVVLIDKITVALTAAQVKSSAIMDMRALATVAVDTMAAFTQTHAIRPDGEVTEL